MQNIIQIAIGVLLAIGFATIAKRTGSYNREKAVYALGLIVAALIYVGFGAFAGLFEWLLAELGGVLFYAIFAVLGARYSGWFLSVGWLLHVFWDAGLHGYSTNFVPFWYPMFCLGFDLMVAARIGFREWSSE